MADSTAVIVGKLNTEHSIPFKSENVFNSAVSGQIYINYALSHAFWVALLRH